MNKLLAILLSVLFIVNVLCISAYAEEELTTEVVEDTESTEDVETVPEEPVVGAEPSAYDKFVAKVEAYASTGYEPTVAYTSDSVASQGVLLEPFADTLKFEVGFTIKTDLPSGVEIYDDPTTPIIEGIRVNGAEISDYRVAIDLDTPKSYLVEVRLVYSEGLTGTIAKISSGDFDWRTIMEEPLLAMQVLYYAIAALSLIIGGIGAASSKKKKVKTANDIAAIVDARVKEGCEAFAIQYTDLLKSNMLPVFNTVVDTNKAVVKAITISTSKTKEAPIALLDVLKGISDVDVEKAIDDARQEVLKNIADTDAKRAAIQDVLSHIASGTYQEVQNVERFEQNAEPQSEPEVVEETSTSVETKSVF